MRLLSAPRLTAAALALVLVGASPASAGTRLVLDKGHVDVVDVEYAEGALELHVHDETVEPGVERDHDDVLFKVLPAAKTAVPDDPAYSFLGTAGSQIWVLPSAQNPDLLWPGLSTEELTATDFVDGSIKLTLHNAWGPGKVAVFSEEPSVLFNSRDGLPDTTTLPAASHTHANWAFSATGYYYLKVTASGTLAATGQTITSAPAYLAFKVG